MPSTNRSTALAALARTAGSTLSSACAAAAAMCLLAPPPR